MTFRPGDMVTYRLLPDTATFRASLVAADDTGMVLRLGDDAPLHIPSGRHLVIGHEGEDIDHFVEVEYQSDDLLHVMRKWTGRRHYFRVDDEFPLRARKLREGEQPARSRVLFWIGQDDAADDPSVSPRVYKMLTEIRSMLGFILEHLQGSLPSMQGTERTAVNISASGIRFVTAERTEPGDRVELTMVLPLHQSVAVVVLGKVVRVEKLRNGKYAVALHFIDASQDAQDVIVQYTLQRQREIVRKQNTREAAI